MKNYIYRARPAYDWQDEKFFATIENAEKYIKDLGVSDRVPVKCRVRRPDFVSFQVGTVLPRFADIYRIELNP